MPVYNFKSITVVPSGKDLIDIVLSKTQRKTPTVIHKKYALPRIRHFYIRKIKTCQQFFHDKLNDIITQFPSVENIHPFYADLINVLYSKDHYKLALGQINTAKNIIDGIGRDQVKLLKYGESLYQCKTLKRTAFGRMCTVIKRQNDNLKFLEETRQHLSRLPSVDTESRTLILCGFPNVGKSSFINKVTRADVEVQPFPFTTKSIYVGHTDYNNLRWQVIDTPGLLDRPLDQHNTIEMISITALAHLQAAIVFILDLSEQCGYSLEQQLSLYKNLRPLFSDKPVIGVINKCEVKSLSDCSKEYVELLKEHFKLPGDTSDSELPQLMEMSTLTDIGVMEVRNTVCGDLLMLRVQKKLNALKTAAMDEDSTLARRIFIAQPDSQELRQPHIPENALKKRARKAAMEKMLHEDEDENVSMAVDGAPVTYKTLREKELAEGDEYETDLRIHWDIKNPDEKYDIIPFIREGHNVLDFFDEDIEARLNALEKEEAELEAKGFYEDHDWHKDDAVDDNDPEFQKTRNTASKIREAKAIRILEMRETKHAHRQVLPRHKTAVNTTKAREDLKKYGLPCDFTEESERGRSRKRKAVQRGQKPDEYHEAVVARSKVSRSRSGVRDDHMEKKVKKLGLISQRSMSRNAKKGEGDRTVPDLKPKHLFSGKRSIGKNDRR